MHSIVLFLSIADFIQLGYCGISSFSEYFETTILILKIILDFLPRCMYDEMFSIKRLWTIFNIQPSSIFDSLFFFQWL